MARHQLFVNALHLFAIKPHLPAGSLSQTGHDFEQRAFTRAGFAGDSDLLQLLLRKTDPFQYFFLTFLLADVRNL